jgi:hypothetical protein
MIKLTIPWYDSLRAHMREHGFDPYDTVDALTMALFETSVVA